MSKAKFKGITKVSVVLGLLATMAIPIASAAGTEEDMTISDSAAPLTAAHAQRLSNLTIHALRKVEDAQTALAASKTADAKSDLTKATYTLETVRAELPGIIVRDQIWKSAKHLSSDKSVDIQADLVPIMDQLNVMEGFAPAKQAKAHVEKASTHAKTGDVKTAATELKAAMAVLDNDEVDVRIDQLQKVIDHSIRLIDQKKPKEALAALKKTSFIEVFETTMYGFPPTARSAQ